MDDRFGMRLVMPLKVLAGVYSISPIPSLVAES